MSNDIAMIEEELETKIKELEQRERKIKEQEEELQRAKKEVESELKHAKRVIESEKSSHSDRPKLKAQIEKAAR